MPTKAPALNIPVITEQLLKAIMVSTKNNTFNFFMVLSCFKTICKNQAFHNNPKNTY